MVMGIWYCARGVLCLGCWAVGLWLLAVLVVLLRDSDSASVRVSASVSVSARSMGMLVFGSGMLACGVLVAGSW